MRTNTGITIYNKALSPATREYAYIRTFIPDVFFTGIEAVIRAKGGVDKDDKVFISIPFNSVDFENYMEPHAYKRLVDRTGYFTLQEGDRIVKGFTTFEITRGVTALDDAHEAFTITSVSTRDYGSDHLKHWAVTAK